MLGRPRVGVPAAEEGLAESLREAGAEPVVLAVPEAPPAWGVALAREWAADAAQISCSRQRLDGLLLAAAEPEKLAGLAIAALRLNLPTVVAAPGNAPGEAHGEAYLSAALAALGLAPLAGEPVPTVVETSGRGPRPGDLVGDFSLVNALRAGLSLGGGPELLVHLAALAREAGTIGFSRTLRVITPETPLLAEPDSAWFSEHGTAGLLARLGDSLNDTPTVAGRLRDVLPESVPEPPPPAGSRLAFVRARSSGAEALCRVSGDAPPEVSGACKVCRSERFAAGVLEDGLVGESSLLVVGGCGPKGQPGLARLERLARVLEEDGPTPPVITDGLPPAGGRGTWISLFSPEAATGGVIPRLRDGDTLRFSFDEGRIRTGVPAGEFEAREPQGFPGARGAGYAARYARSALPALEGAGFR